MGRRKSSHKQVYLYLYVNYLAPPESLSPMTGAPTLMAISIT